jgi:hypothetical protein
MVDPISVHTFKVVVFIELLDSVFISIVDPFSVEKYNSVVVMVEPSRVENVREFVWIELTNAFELGAPIIVEKVN